MSSRRKALGRGLEELVHASFSSIVEAAQPGAPQASEPAPQAAPPAPAGPPQVAAVTSGKGGTGKSFLTSNLGVLLSASPGATVIDADFGLANMHLLYDLTPARTAAHLLTGEAALGDVLIEGPCGVRLVPGGSGVPELAAMDPRRLASLAAALSGADALAGWLLVDTPSGIDRQSLMFLLAADQVLVVTTEDITALTDAYAVIKTVLSHRPAATLVVVVNRARSYDGGLEAFQRLAHVARRFLGRELTMGGIIPEDEAVARSVSTRVPVALAEPGAPSSRALASLARRLPTFPAPGPRQVEPFSGRLRRVLQGPLFAPSGA
jgi:flagellar biosynthesis protein FlhG